MKRKIVVLPGSNLESVVYTLLAAKARGESVYCDFNGHKLYSDTVSMDSAYMEVLGQTKADYDKAQEEWRQNYKREQKEAEERAKANIPNWIEKGQSLIFPERYAEWEKLVIALSSDLYHELELNSALEIMTALENGATMEEAKQMFGKQRHSGMSASIVRNILFAFSSKGPEFWEATAYGEISQENKQLLEAKKQENIQLAQSNQPKSNGPKL